MRLVLIYVADAFVADIAFGAQGMTVRTPRDRVLVHMVLPPKLARSCTHQARPPPPLKSSHALSACFSFGAGTAYRDNSMKGLVKLDLLSCPVPPGPDDRADRSPQA